MEAPPIKQEGSGSSHGGVTIDSIYYYGKSVYQDVNLRSYFGSIRPPTRLTFGFRLGRCIIIHFPKRTFIHFFLPRRPRRLKRREKSRPVKEKGRWGAFGKVGPIGCLHSSDGTEEERNEVRGRGAGKRVESIRLDDREKQNEIRIWPKKKQGYGYHDRSPSIKKNLSKSLRVSGAFKHPKYAGIENDIAFLIENDDSFRKTNLFKFFFPKKSRSDRPTSHLLKRTLPAVRPSLNYSVMQYLLNTKKKMHFDPVVVLNHFVAPGVAEPSTMGGANAQGRSLDKRIRSCIAFFVESSTSEKKCLAEAKKRVTHFIRQANDLRFAGTTKTTISLFPFFGATFFFPRDGVGVYNNLFFEDAREQLLGQLRRKCWNLMGKDKVMELIEKFIDLNRIGELIRGIEMMIEIILRNRRIPYGSLVPVESRAKLDTASEALRQSISIISIIEPITLRSLFTAGAENKSLGGPSFSMQASSYLCLVRRLPNIQVTALVVISSLGRPSRCLSGHYPGEGMGWGRKRSVLLILFGLGKASFFNSRSGGAYVEEAVEEHHHGSGPDTWGINSAARIVNQGKNETIIWKSPPTET
ncbi:hypothetical protein KY290_032410 [Solanum tuberosum]|uniref:Ribosomal protein S3 n=1 Tax=Solanum tuberosum TaxID=4113 RepID=A0ABQ7UC24_SOLTU|nr:hypothetical protein KY290_032410 [Solanum tuberosum]